MSTVLTFIQMLRVKLKIHARLQVILSHKLKISLYGLQSPLSASTINIFNLIQNYTSRQKFYNKT